MTRITWALLMLSTFSLAQGTQGTQPSQQPSQPLVQAKKVQGVKALGGNTPSPGDMYCSGFITTEKIPDNHYIVGGWNSPDQSHFAGSTDLVYIHGPELKEGDRLAIVRRVKDPNRYEFFKGSKATIASLGQPYFERGYVKVINVQKNVASAVPELSCGDFVPGDLAIPFVEREKPVFRQVAVDRLALPSGKASGRIVMADEFDGMLGSMHKVYLNIGEDKGLKPGDYLRATRTYEYSYRDPEAGLSTKATAMEDTQYKPPKPPAGYVKDLPRRALGDMIVLHVHPRSATAMIMTALEDIRVGDGVELMDISNAPELSSSSAGPSTTPVTAAAVNPNPPTINCTASPSTVRAGESATISCDTSSPDNRPVRVRFTATSGKVSPSGNNAMLDTANSGAGPITVRATAVDDRDMSTAATATVNVEPAPSALPTARKTSELDFAPNSARVDNRAKAVLDDVALKLQQDPGMMIVLAGGVEGKEPPALAQQRARNAMGYLTQSKGIDSKRIQPKSGSQQTRTVDIWSVPAGAAMPQ